MERIDSCYLCGAVEREVVLDLLDYEDTYLNAMSIDYANIERKIFKCDRCGFVFRSPRLDEEESSRLYSGKPISPYRKKILQDQTGEEYFDKIVSLPNDQSELFHKINWLKVHLNDYLESQSKKRMIDVGCGMGAFLHYFTKYLPEWECFGLEVDEIFGKVAKAKLNVPIYTEYWNSKFYDDLELDSKFDLITLVSVLEHVPDPIGYLISIRNGLMINGLIFIETPSSKMIRYLEPGHDTFMFPHLYYFDEDSTKTVIKKAGFKTCYFEYITTFRNKTQCFAIAKKTIV